MENGDNHTGEVRLACVVVFANQMLGADHTL